MLSILSWNIRQGGGSRVVGIIQALVKSKATIVVLSEYKNNDKGEMIRAKLLSAGYRYQAVTSARPDVNSVLIASKLPCNTVLHPKADTEYAHNIVEIQTEALNLIGVYLPHKKKHTLLPYIQQVISATETPYVIAGDYNTGINGVDQVGSSFWYQPEMLAFGKLGYVDAFRVKHNTAIEYSWYSHQGNGYRYDHTYIHEMLLPIIKRCEYLHTWREQKLSDHSPMLLSF